MRRRNALPRGLRQVLKASLGVAKDPLLALWSLYILLVPVYLWKSGLPQPGDMLVVVLGPLVFVGWKPRLFRLAIRPTRALLLFTAYVVLSNVLWSVITNSYTISLKWGFLLSPLFYAYNAFFFITTLLLYVRYRERFLWLTLQVTFFAVVLQSLISLVFSRGGARGDVLFNNPNQLGYFAILSASILVVGRRRLRLGVAQTTIGLLACTYLSLFSASKAALGATAVLVIVGLITNPRLIIVSAAGFFILLTVSDPFMKAMAETEYRLQNDQSLEFFQERGYDRIVNNKQYWILGAGEGDYERFKDTTMIGSHELHSSGGTIFFCYGIAGSLLFLNFIFRLLAGATIQEILVLLPAAAFGLSHQGLRSTQFWVLLALFIAIRDLERRRRQLAKDGSHSAERERLILGAHAT